jgi:hypothetical protein
MFNYQQKLQIDELKLFRSALSYSSNACSKTEMGSIHMTITKATDVDSFHCIMFQYIDTAPNVPLDPPKRQSAKQ